jgi:uncharacterized protein (DUF302 family)
MTIRFREVLPHLVLAAGLALAFTAAVRADAPKATAPEGGVIRIKSAYGFTETVSRLKADVEGKGIRVFMVLNQAALAGDVGINARPSTLLEFGNPLLGARFIVAEAQAGLDWPVRLLVYQDENGRVWTAYTDFSYIARRHRIDPGDPSFRTATGVITGITSSVAPR